MPRLDRRQFLVGVTNGRACPAFREVAMSCHSRAGAREGGRKTHMADVSGVKITDLTACGTSDDGEHVWSTHRLGGGTEYPLVYPFEAVGYLITVLAETARSAQRRRIARNPREVVEGADVDAIPIEAARVGTSPENSAAMLHVTTA